MRPLYFLTGLFFLLSPLSLAGGFAYVEHAKYLRVLTTLAIVVLSVLMYRGFRFRRAGRALMVFVAFFFAASLWSDLPHWALFYKSMFVLTCLSGFAVAYAPRSAGELRKSIRFLGSVAGFGAVMAFVLFLRSPDTATVHGRMTVMGINANTIGQTAAPFLIFCAYLWLHEKSRMRKRLLLVSCVLLALILLSTGSRGAALMACLGLMPLVALRLKNPRQLLAVGVPLFLMAAAATLFAEEYNTTRMFDELTKNTRSGIFGYGMSKFLEAPLLGHGWLHYGNRWASMLSVVVQTLAETGIIGGVVLAVSVTVILQELHTRRRLSRVQPGIRDLYALSCALVVSVLVHGVVESSMVMGTTLNPFCLGLGVGLVDRLPEFARTSVPSIPTAPLRVAVRSSARKMSRRRVAGVLQR